MARIVYIAGAGHSGSTLLDVVLGNHPAIVSVGELSYVFHDWERPTRRCSCGRRHQECTLWSGLRLEEPWDALERLTRTVERIGRLPQLMAGRVPRDLRQRYRAAQRGVFDYVEAQTGRSIVVDSSKTFAGTAGRPLALAEVGGMDVRVIHLVRNGPDTMSSYLHPQRRRAHGHKRNGPWLGLQTVLGWVGANVVAARVSRALGRNRYLRVHYEQFMQDPRRVLEAIGRFGGFDVEALTARIERNDTFDLGHLARGNREVVRTTAVRLQRDRRLGAPELNWAHRMMFTALGGWLNHRYGYDGRSVGGHPVAAEEL